MAKDTEEFKLPEAGGEQTGSTEERLLALERAFANLSRDTRNIRGVLHFQNFATDPTTGNEGDIAVVGGKLKIYTSGAWTVVGTQS